MRFSAGWDHMTGKNIGGSLINIVMSVFFLLFGIFWTTMAFSMGAPIAIFGFLFIIVGIVLVVNSIRNIFRKNTPVQNQGYDGYRPVDPVIERDRTSPGRGYCPYCGARIEGDYEYCRTCGKDLH